MNESNIDRRAQETARGSDHQGRPLVELTGLSKSFDGVTVLADFSATLRAGEICGLLGANGSGKSTVIKLLSGYHVPSGGSVQRIADPQTGEAPRIAFVHQDLGLVESISVSDNIALSCGYVTSRLGRIQRRRTVARTRELLRDFGLDCDPETPVAELGGTERRLIAIARALFELGDETGLLVLDEPTAALPSAEIHRVFDLMRSAAARGAGILFVCHNLSEALNVADRVVVLRDGRAVLRTTSQEATVDQLAGAMFGQGLALDALGAARPESAGAATDRTGAPALRVQGVSGERLRDVSFDAWPGEIVAVTGLLGCGQSDLGRIIAGVELASAGSISIDGGRPTSFRSPIDAIAAGVGYVPPDRRQSGGVLTMDARENATLSTLDSFFVRGRLQKRRELRTVQEWMREVGVVPVRPRQNFGAFSGGNQQKLVFARIRSLSPRVVVLDEPTQGVDAATIPELHGFVREMAADGCAIVVITGDLEEAVSLADRVLVLEEGSLSAELPGATTSLDQLQAAVEGGRRVRAR